MYARMGVAVLRAMLLEAWYRVFPPMINGVTKVYAFNESDEPGFHAPLPASIMETHDAPPPWDAVEDATGWPRSRLDVRYLLNGKKYRRFCSGEQQQQPTSTSEDPPVVPSMGTDRKARILSARLLPFPDGTLGAQPVDVTSRIQKCAGPNRDFGGGTVTVRDAFPFDDHDDNAARFRCIRILDASFKMWDVPYDPDRALTEGRI